jgi:serine/threonine-protein kinase RsbW
MASVPGRPACGRPADLLADSEHGLAPPLWPTLVVQLRSDSLAVRAAVVRLQRAATRLGLAAELCDSLEIVLAEALNNVVEHAYRQAVDGWIVVELDLLEDCAVCRIWDGGRPMPGGQPPRPAAHDLAGPLSSLPEGGFGWSLIGKLAHPLRYDRIEGRNCLAFAVGLRPAGVGA